MTGIEIYTYSCRADKISISLNVEGKIVVVTISYTSFETWLYQSKKLDWLMTYAEDDIIDVSTTGTMAADEYFDMLDDYTLKCDLMEYMQNHPINYNGKTYDNIFSFTSYINKYKK